MNISVPQNLTSNVLDMIANRGSTVTQGGPLTNMFQPAVGRPAWMNFMAQAGLPTPALQTMPFQSNAQQLQGAGQLMSTVGRLLNSMGRSMQAQAAYQQLVTPQQTGGQNQALDQVMQALMSLVGGGGFAQGGGMPQGPQNYLPTTCGGGVPQGPQNYLPTYGGTPQGPQNFVPIDGGVYQPGGGGAMDENRATKVLNNNFEKLSGGHKCFSTDDLKRAAADGSDPELQRAAKFALDNPTYMRGLDTADHGLWADGLFSKRDLNVSMQTGKLSQGDQAVLDTVGRYFNELYNQSGRGSLNKGDFAEMARGGNMPNGQPTPPEMQAAAQALLSKPALFDRLDAAEKGGRRLDGKISKGDFEVTQTRGREAGSASGAPNMPGIQLPSIRPQIVPGQPGYGIQTFASLAMEGHLTATGRLDLAAMLSVMGQRPAVQFNVQAQGIAA